MSGLVAATPDPAALWTAVGDPVLAVTEAGVDGAVVQLLALAAWGCLAWLTAAASAAALAHLPGVAGRVARRLADGVTPALVRRAVEAALGLSALAGVAAPTVAAAAPPPAVTSTVEARGAADLARVIPSADWPGLGTAASGTPSAGTAASLPSLDWPATPTAARPAAVPTAAPDLVAAAPTRTAPHDSEAVVVHRGDTLWDLAARHLGPGATAEQVAREWPAWHAANRAVIGPDPDRLLPGQRLVPPT